MACNTFKDTLTITIITHTQLPAPLHTHKGDTIISAVGDNINYITESALTQFVLCIGM